MLKLCPLTIHGLRTDLPETSRGFYWKQGGKNFGYVDNWKGAKVGAWRGWGSNPCKIGGGGGRVNPY